MKQPRSVIDYRPSVTAAMVTGGANPSRPTITSDRKFFEAQEPQYPLKSPWGRPEEPRVTAPPLDACQHKPPMGAGHSSQNGILAGSPAQVLQAPPHPAVLEERSRLAREIHDTLVQEFAGILLHLEAVEGSAEAEWCRSSACLARARELAKSGLEDARRMLLGLRPKSLESATLLEVLPQLAERFSHDSRIACKYRADGEARDLPAEIQDELYRVAQEALSNVLKHSRATSVSLLLVCGPGVVVFRIKDNGQGFGAAKPQAGGHGYGLATMRERAHRLGGNIEIDSAPGNGTEVTITVPLRGEIK